MFINSHFTALFFSAVVDNILFFLCGFFLVFKLFGGGVTGGEKLFPGLWIVTFREVK